MEANVEARAMANNHESTHPLGNFFFTWSIIPVGCVLIAPDAYELAAVYGVIAWSLVGLLATTCESLGNTHRHR